MKMITALFRHVLIPVVFAFVVLAGILAAAVSALIEFVVLQQWLRPNGTGVIFLPLIIVIALEGTKLFLHLFEAAFKQSALSDKDRKTLNSFKKISAIVKWGLVIFSFMCSLVFTANSFYFKVPEGQSNELKQAQAEIIAEYESRRDAAIRDADYTYQQTLEAASKRVESAQDSFDSIEIVYTPKYKYERTTAQKEEARKALEAAQANYEQVQATASQERTEAIQVADGLNSQWRDDQMAALEKTVLAETANDNPFLSSFLLAFSHTFFQKTYTRGAYLIWVMIISLSISILLEAVISVAQHVISCPPNALDAISEGDSLTDKERNKLTHGVKIMVSMAVAFSIYLIYGAAMELTYNRHEIIAALVCCLVVVLVDSVIAVEPITDGEKGVKRAAKGFLSEARTVIIEGLLSFAGYVLLGIAFGETFTTLSLSAVGVSIGNSLGHILHLPPIKVVPKE